MSVGFLTRMMDMKLNGCVFSEWRWRGSRTCNVQRADRRRRPSMAMVEVEETGYTRDQIEEANQRA